MSPDRPRSTESVTPVSLAAARRLLLTNQHLGPTRPGGSKRDALLATVRDLCYVQWDPVNVVAPSHLLALWNRVDGFRPADLERLMWKDRALFIYYAHAAAIVLTEDLPIFASLMRRYPESLSDSWGNWRKSARTWIPAHAALRRRILRELESGPKRLGEFTDHTPGGKAPGGWGSSSDVSAMLTHLLMSGDVTIVGQQGNQNIWGRMDRFLPPGHDRTGLPVDEVEQRAAARAIHALGVATPSEINFYFTRGQYQDLPGALTRLLQESSIHRVRVEGLPDKEERYICDRDLALVGSEAPERGTPLLSLLPPFDTLTCLRRKIRGLFGFDHFVEMYVPEPKRRYGYYVLPVVYGERFVGRIDPKLDRESGELRIRAVHAEPGCAADVGIARALAQRIDELASFLGAREVVYTSRVPAGWRSALR